MDNNNIFANGVYPHGFHCIIYYLHAAFGIQTYILFRVFSIVQTLFIHLVLLLSLRVICRLCFSPYIGTAAYLMLNIYNDNAIARYSSTLPQEYGMLFNFSGRCACNSVLSGICIISKEIKECNEL